jgi:EamA-like transporter family.
VLHLLVVSLVWAFSFGLTKDKLHGLDSAFISAARLGLALLVFLPFLRLRGLSRHDAAILIVLGAVQFGLMYLALNESYRHLAAHQVVLFTLTTPVLVTVLADLLERTLRPRALVAALLAVIGSMAVVIESTTFASTLSGLLLVQGSNLAFAFGQVFYRRFRQQRPALRDREIFGLLYLGAVAVTVPIMWIRDGAIPESLSTTQLSTLVYLGVLASGLCFFWWNLGATRVNAGTLAVFNNAKVPLGVACSLIFFNESGDLPQLALGGALLVAAVALAETKPKPV